MNDANLIPQSRKFRVDDLAILPNGSRRTIVEIRPAHEGGHCYAGFKVSRSTMVRLSKSLARLNVGCKIGSRSNRLYYYVRVDRLRKVRYTTKIQTGQKGRPRLVTTRKNQYAA